VNKQPESRTYVLRGYVKERPDGRFIGVCLRPNLIVEGRSSGEALHKLQGLIHAYVQDAVKDGNLAQMMSLRAPATFYREYWTGRVLLALSHSFKPFTETCNIPRLA
jgi:hypothetical protein